MAAAVCEIVVNGELCGVQAIGRCTYCGRAFCQSHQARYRDSRDLMVMGLDATACCLECLERMEAGAAQWEADRMQPAQEASAYFTSGSAQAAFRARGVSSVGLVTVSPRVGGMFRSRVVDDVTSAGRGWLLGEFTWKHTTFQYGEDVAERVKKLTVLIDTLQAQGEPSRIPVLPVSQRREGYEVHRAAAHSRWDLVEIVEAYQAAKKLVDPSV